MDNNFHDDLIWTEKYRPQTINDCILPKRIKSIFEGFVKHKTFTNLLLTGGPGVGKTTIARALCRDLGYDCIIVNASDNRNIDLVRNTIREYSSIMSLDGKQKAIILDEADGLTTIAQAALRPAMEEFAHVRFILTCNFKNKLIPALHSRTTTIEFNLQEAEKQELMIGFLVRVFDILNKEKITFDKKVVGQIIKKFYPDNRRILNELEKYSVSGSIDAGLLSSSSGANIDALIQVMKSKRVTEVRQWVADNADTDPAMLFRQLYDGLQDVIQPESIPQMILTIADFQHKSYFAMDQEINTAAFIWTLIGGLEFK